MNINLDPVYSVILEQKETYTLILVGCGGTGGYIAEAIARFAWEHKQTGKTVDIIFIDPDTVEEKNIGRQRFAPAELGLNKAVCLANRYNLAFGLNITAVQRPFCADTLEDLGLRYPTNNTLLIGAVDNALARQEMANAVAAQNGRLWCLDAGNALHNGNVYIGNVTKLNQLTFNDEMLLLNGLPSPYVQNPALLQPETPQQEESGSCAEHIQRREQSMVVNQQMGSLLARYLDCWLVERRLTFMHTAVSLEIPSMQTTLATKCHVEKVFSAEYLRDF